jgi:hypothetical protein
MGTFVCPRVWGHLGGDGYIRVSDFPFAISADASELGV